MAFRAKELNASDAVALLEHLEPTTPVEAARRDLALGVLDDVQRLDARNQRRFCA